VREMKLKEGVNELLDLVERLSETSEEWKEEGDLEFSYKAYSDAELYEVRIRIKRKKEVDQSESLTTTTVTIPYYTSSDRQEWKPLLLKQEEELRSGG